MMSRVASYSAAVVAMVVAAPAQAALPADPLGSPMWQRLGKTLFGDAPVRFDPRVRVIFPDIAENQRQFPVAIDARGIAGVKRILLFADLNPIPLAVDYTLDAAQPCFSRADRPRVPRRQLSSR